MVSTAITAAFAGLAFQVGGMDVSATYLRSDLPGCFLAQQRVKNWQQEGRVAIFHRAMGWCVAGAVIGHQWVAEQWIAEHRSGEAWGWRVLMPMTFNQQTRLARSTEWPYEIFDRQIGTRLRIRHSWKSLSDHHQESVALLNRSGISTSSKQNFSLGHFANFSAGQFVVSGRDPQLGSYSIFLQR